LAKPGYTAPAPCRPCGQEEEDIVNNESSEIVRMFNNAFDGVGAKPATTIRRHCAAD